MAPFGKPLGQVALAEARRNWPFVVGFAVTFGLVLRLSASLPGERADRAAPRVSPVAGYGSRLRRRCRRRALPLVLTRDSRRRGGGSPAEDRNKSPFINVNAHR
eukprot:SM000028S10217  [mRNA]  locus=s28:918524:918835:- [translate_table: standard]